MSESKYIKESKDYISKNASSWYVRSSKVGETMYCSMTFIDFVQKVHVAPDQGFKLNTDLVAEAIANLTLTADQARDFANAILYQLDNFSLDSKKDS